MKETFDYRNDLIAAKEVNTKVKKPKIMVITTTGYFTEKNTLQQQ